MDERPLHRKADDKRQGRNGGGEAGVPQCAATPALLGARRRLLRVADGPVPVVKSPMRVVMRSRRAIRSWPDSGRHGANPEGEVVPSCTIITTEANALLRPIHNRMPVILSREMDRFWLDRSVQEPAAIGSILSPYPADAMELYEVSTLVNSYANDGPEIIEPVPYS